MDRRRLLFQTRELALQIGEQHVGEVVAEAPAYDHAQRGDVGAVLRERVRRHLPAALTQRIDTSKTVQLSISSVSVNAKTGSSSPRVISRNGPSSAISADEPRGHVARVALHLSVPRESQPEEVVVLGDDLRARAGRS